MSHLYLFRNWLPLVTKRHVEKRLIPNLTVDQLWPVIVNVDAYQDFLPFCRSSSVIAQSITTRQSTRSESTRSESTSTSTNLNHHHHHHSPYPYLLPYQFEAVLTVGIPPFLMETYTSRVSVDPQRYAIRSTSVQRSQHLESLDSAWTLSPVQAATTITAATATPMNHYMIHENENNHHEQETETLSCTSTEHVNHPIHCPPPHRDSECDRECDRESESVLVEFHVDMSVRDPIIAKALDAWLPQVALQQVNAFVQQAQRANHYKNK